MLKYVRLHIADSAGRKVLEVFRACMERILLSGMWGNCLCMFQTRSDEEDAENDDLNDAGEFSVGRARSYTVQRSVDCGNGV